jgi:Pyridoxamine 5'-phosphate oxidase
MDEELHKFIITLLHGHNTLGLATVREDGWPQATSVAYANDGLAIYVATGIRDQLRTRVRPHLSGETVNAAGPP